MTKSIAFLVQNNHVLYNSIPVAQYALRAGIDLIDRSSNQEFDPLNCGVDLQQYNVVYPYGSVQFARLCCDKGLEHVQYSEEGFRTDFWIEKFGDKAVNFTGTLMKAGEVLEHLGYAKEAHVRPNHVDKAFVAAVFNQDSWSAVCQERSLDEDLDVFVSPLVEISGEYRCWIVGGKVVQVSKYQQGGEMCIDRVNLDHPILSHITALAETYLPNEMVVMDVAEVGDKVLFLEFNSIHSSGWYAADINVVLDSVVQHLTK